MRENANKIGKLGIHKKGRAKNGQGLQLQTLLIFRSSYLVVAGVVDLLSPELVLGLLELLVALLVLVPVSLEVVFSPLAELALLSVLSAFLPLPFVSLAIALVLL
jgi:hypothetical protein